MTSPADGSFVSRLDTDALTRPLTYREARAFVPDARPTGWGAALRSGRLSTWVLLLVALVLTGVVIWSAVVPAVHTGQPLAILPAVAGGAAAAIIMIVTGRRRTVQRARMRLLAEENGWQIDPKGGGAGYRPRIFRLGTDAHTLDVIRMQDDPRMEWGRRRFIVKGNRGSKTTVELGYLALQLPQKLPNILLVPARQAGADAHDLDPDQALSLEGDFDRHFRLYCPAGYEQDALYLFTPDVMALFLDRSRDLTAEIIDDWLILSAAPSVLFAPTVQRWTNTLGIVDALTTKLDQWGRWRDDTKRKVRPRGTPRALARPAPGVGRAGARLAGLSPKEQRRRTWTAAGIILGVVVIGYSTLAIFFATLD